MVYPGQMKDDISIILQKNIKFQQIVHIQKSIAAIFNTDVTIVGERIDINPFYDTSRVQYNAAKIIDSQVGRVSVSIDSHKAEIHDAFRGEEGAFDAAINGMKLMQKMGQSFQINTTVTRRNMNSLDQAIALAENIGADALHLFFLVPVGCGLEIPDNERITADEYEQLLHWFALEMQKSSIEMRATCAPHLQRVLLQIKKASSGQDHSFFHNVWV